MVFLGCTTLDSVSEKLAISSRHVVVVDAIQEAGQFGIVFPVIGIGAVQRLPKFLRGNVETTTEER